MSSTIEQIKDRLSIEEVVGSYIKLEKAGKHVKALCPFHNEKTPSFIVSPDRGTFYCFGCGKKGDIFTFVQEYEGIEFVDAMKMLAEKVGVTIAYERDDQRNERNAEKKLLDQATVFFQKNLTQHTQAQTYLKERGIDTQDIEKWCIGVAQDEWSSLYEHFTTQGTDKTMLDRVGLAKQGEKGGWYDRFRSRIMFPIADAQGGVVGFTGRLLTNDEKQAKYVNSPETALFSKSHILYGYHLAKASIRKHNFSILVEGQFDVIAAHKMGYANAVATSGTALTDDQLKLLQRLSSRLVLALDADGAGFKASERAWKMALKRGMDVKIAQLPVGKDPADLLKENPELWKQVIKDAQHIIDFLAQHVLSKKLNGRDQALAIHNEIIPYIAQLESTVEQSHFVEKLAAHFSLATDVLWKEVESAQVPKKNNEIHITPEKEIEQKQSQYSLEQQLLGILAWQKTIEKPSIEVEKVNTQFRELIGDDAYMLLERESDVDGLIFLAEEMYTDDKVLRDVVEELFIRLEKNILEYRRTALKTLLKKEDVLEKQDQNEDILKELHEISKRIEGLG